MIVNKDPLQIAYNLKQMYLIDLTDIQKHALDNAIDLLEENPARHPIPNYTVVATLGLLLIKNYDKPEKESLEFAMNYIQLLNERSKEWLEKKIKDIEEIVSTGCMNDTKIKEDWLKTYKQDLEFYKELYQKWLERETPDDK